MSVPIYQDSGPRAIRHPGRVPQRNSLPGRNEIRPKKPLPGKPPDHQPANSYKSAKFTDQDDWDSIARKYNVDVGYLIQFNFNTTVHEEVNYWLHHLVGCDTATSDRTNWKFSSTAKRPYVYIPYNVENYNATFIDPNPPQPPPVVQLHGPDLHETLHKFCHIQSPARGAVAGVGTAMVGISGAPKIVGVGAASNAGVVEGIGFGLGALAVVWQGTVGQACNLAQWGDETPLFAKAYLKGAALGYVLAADGHAAWRHQQYTLYADNNYQRPDLQRWYSRGLDDGSDRGRPIAYKTSAREELFRWLDSRLAAKTHFRSRYGSANDARQGAYEADKYDNAPTEKMIQYYLLCGDMFEVRIQLY